MLYTRPLGSQKDQLQSVLQPAVISHHVEHVLDFERITEAHCATTRKHKRKVIFIGVNIGKTDSSAIKKMDIHNDESKWPSKCP
jgi:hypothetical protein